jgi:type IV pilus assembly protein PilB
MLPLMTGPAVVLRLLDSANIKRRVSDMGFNDEQLHVLRKFTASNQGMTIVSGPTGSGKTTTLYALLREISSLDRHVATIEDPVEYRLPLINQVQVRHTESKPLTFASALRALMRMDPDVILVGEIRDAETAKVALDAAITGHLVLSTVHARDAAGTFERLVEIGAPPYVVADAVSVSVAQRLIRRVHTCATMMPVSDSEARRLEMLGLEIPKMLAHPTGCELCANTGYQGRVAIAEVLTSTPQIREMIRAMAGHDAIVSEARKFGFETMADHTQKMLVNGVTSLEEVGRILEDITDIGSA